MGASPFHAGEQAVQERLGVREQIEPWARKVVRPQLPEQHRDFYAQLPFLVAAARDGEGRPWATLLTGPPGFAQAPDPHTLVLETRPLAGDALEGELGRSSELGLLGIELATRRRNRVNGGVARAGDGRLILSVDQSFGNCPQYIREREWRFVGLPERPAPPRRLDRLDETLRRWITQADTFFIATGKPGDGNDPTAGMDASHRGGEPGFVRVSDDGRLVFPDYAGNNHFNTVGNLVVDPRVGLLFVDFAEGSLLQLTGRAEIDWDSPEVARHPGAQRLVVIEIEELRVLEAALPLRWDDGRDSVRSLRLVGKHRESEDVTSFLLASRDGGPLPDFAPGQHLPLELEVPGHGRVRRSYSLSNGPGGAGYRISVKREPLGVASRHLHDALQEGAILEARPPAGDFVLEHGERPVMLLSAGVGVTPMLSMLHALVESGDPRPVHFVHVARDGAHHPLAEEVRQLAAKANVTHHVAYTQPRPQDRRGEDFHSRGRIDASRLAERLPGLDADFYLCGPTSFMASLQEGLEARGVPPERIHSESFGPAAGRRAGAGLTS